MAKDLRAVFDRLDYWDDGYVDGYVSHVGLRRILLETPQLTDELGGKLARYLLASAESNLYGRLNQEEFVMIGREIEKGGRGRGPRHTVHSAAVSIALPNNIEREERLDYLEQYSCKPPPMFLILISLAQIGVFVWHVLILEGKGKVVGPDGPAYTNGTLIFNPYKKKEAWRFLTYMFVHSGYFHIVFNILIQLLLGLPLEMVHRWWRILIIYLAGVLAGSLATSISDPTVYLAGGSGGVYALVMAHLANVIFNWSEMEFPGIRLLTFLVLSSVDIGVAVYYRYVGVNIQVSFVSHLAGAAVGLLLGVVVLKNLRVRTWEQALWWCSLLITCGLYLAAIVWNAVIIFV